MTIAAIAIQTLTERTPIGVEWAEWNETELLLGGADWNMSVLTPWRLLHQGKFVIGSDNTAAIDVIKVLKGNLIVGCKSQSSSEVLDPALLLGSGHILEIFSAGPLEPWTLFFRDKGRYVASPTD